MSEYKLLKEFGELFPGMKFKSPNNDIYIVIVPFRIGGFHGVDESTGCKFDFVPGIFIDKLALIHDPRKKNEMSIQEKINDHKKQIEILEKELQKESLKNVFVKDQYYKIKTKDDTFICKFGMSDFDKSFIWVECVDRFTRKISTNDIQKVWHVENLKDVFGFCNPIFERKY